MGETGFARRGTPSTRNRFDRRAISLGGLRRLAMKWITQRTVMTDLVAYRRHVYRFVICFVVLADLATIQSYAQQIVRTPGRPLTLSEAVDFALTNYPAVKASVERANAGREGVRL